MTLDVILGIVAVLAAIVEFVVWEFDLLWHKEEERDPRNFPPPR